MDSTGMRKDVDPAQVPATTEADATNSRAISMQNNRIESRDLFVATKEITIGHEGEAYRLRLTAQNKLILTK